MSSVLFFNGTATTEIYTYWTTLSRHDALPSCHPCLVHRRTGWPNGSDYRCRWERGHRSCRRCPCGCAPRPARSPCSGPWCCRSEEHTSELQSLMRISYAVFCLKTKIPTPTDQEHVSTTAHINHQGCSIQ